MINLDDPETLEAWREFNAVGMLNYEYEQMSGLLGIEVYAKVRRKLGLTGNNGKYGSGY